MLAMGTIPFQSAVESKSMTEKPTDLVSMRDLQRRLRLSRPSIYRLIEKGEIEALHIGRSLRITNASVEAFLARRLSAEQAGGAGDFDE